ncbi:MAG: EthD domain-containing protein [Alphaproteobacteria bacterium]
MIKAITCIKRKPGLSVEDFQAYWRGEHAAIVTKLPNIRRYVQSHALPGGYRKGELPYDGIAEIWVDAVDTLRAWAGSEAYGAVQRDEENFIDRSKLALILTQEHVIKDGAIPQGALKNIEFVPRKPGMAVEAFQTYWREVHGPIAAEIEVIRRYVQSHTLPGAYRDGRRPAIDGCAITWFDGIDSMRQSAQSPAYGRTREDEPNFIDTSSEIDFIITTEHVIVAG